MKVPDPARSLEEQDEDVLHAMLVWGEARGESPEGQAAVAYVPVTRLNLKKSGRSPKRVETMTLRRIMLQRYAFSCFNRSDPNRAKLLRPIEAEGLRLWSTCWDTAAAARDGRSANPAPGATHYCVQRLWSRPAAVPARPQWFEDLEIADGNTHLVATIGGHVFAKARF